MKICGMPRRRRASCGGKFLTTPLLNSLGIAVAGKTILLRYSSSLKLRRNQLRRTLTRNDLAGNGV